MATKTWEEVERFLAFVKWSEKRVVSKKEYEQLKRRGELDPLGVYCIHDADMPERGFTKSELSTIMNMFMKIYNEKEPSQ